MISIMKRTKKQIECAYLDKFLTLMNIHPTAITCRESPDFILEMDKMIGLEIVSYHSIPKEEGNKPRRLIEEEWRILHERIIEEVKKHDELTETKGYLDFRELEIPSRKKYDDFVKELIDSSLKLVITGSKYYLPDEHHPLMKKYLSSFSLEKVGCSIMWDWNHNAAFIGLTEDELINTIQPKTEKVMKFKSENIEEYWLLVVDGPYLSQEMGLRLQYKLPDYTRVDKLLRESKFKAMYIFQYMFDVVYQWPGWAKVGEEKLISTVTDKE